MHDGPTRKLLAAIVAKHTAFKLRDCEVGLSALYLTGRVSLVAEIHAPDGLHVVHGIDHPDLDGVLRASAASLRAATEQPSRTAQGVPVFSEDGTCVERVRV